MYDFDKITDRKNTNSWKYDFYDEYGKTPDTLSMWIADMDFPTVPEVLKKLEDVAKFGIFGYSR
ncbi:MAG: aminotransferase, partial [Christensenellaceae bacterium]|nr:aminotransferase [Christensenellaceae bacterium]